MNNPFVNLAFLETIRARNSGYFVDHFVSFLAVAATSAKVESMTIDEAKVLLDRELGLTIPISSVELILNRATRKKILIKDNRRFLLISDAATKIFNRYVSRKEDIAKSQEEFYQSFISYSNSRFAISLTVDQSEKLFANFFKRYQIELLDRTAPSMASSGDIKNPDHLISSFITELFKSKDATFEHLERIVKGYLITNFINIRGSETDANNLKGVTAILDTPVLMGICGFNGKLRTDACKEMLNLGSSLGVHFAVFEHTYEEWEGIFNAWVNDLRNRNFKKFNTSTLALLTAKGLDAAAIEAMIPRLKGIIETQGIKVVDRPKFNTEYSIDETALQAHLEPLWKEDLNHRLERDIMTISGVMHLRKGRSRMSLNEHPAIFITSNSGLINGVGSFFKDEISQKSIPLVASDFWLTNICWMTSPDIFPSLPQHLLVANCYGIINADDRFWESFLSRLRRLKKETKVTGEDYRLVRYEIDLKQSVKDLSVTNGIEFSDEQVLETLRSTKEKILKRKNDEIKILIEAAEARTKRIEQVSENISICISWGYLFVILLPIALIFIGSVFYQESLAGKLGGIVLSVAGILFDFSLWKRRQSLSLKLKIILAAKLTDFLGGKQ